MKKRDFDDSYFQILLDEFTSKGIGVRIYSEVLAVIKALILGGGYPIMYSPVGKWDEEAFLTLANDFIMNKLCKKNYLIYLLQANSNIRTFRKSLESVFRRFLISQKKRTVFDNLFRRTNKILNEDKRFKNFSNTQKAHSYWGLAIWNKPKVFNNSDSHLVQSALEMSDPLLIDYRPEAKKLPHIISEKDLANFIYDFFNSVNSLLSLSQLMTVFKYKFNLLEVSETSLDDPASIDINDKIVKFNALKLTNTEMQEMAREAIFLLSDRQRQILMAFQEPEATLSSIANSVGCSKSTVDNELKRVFSVFADLSDSEEQARDIYDIVIAIMISKKEIGMEGEV
jgi:DNA-directed RNA polymerase specialized sigma24 family protein